MAYLIKLMELPQLEAYPIYNASVINYDRSMFIVVHATLIVSRVVNYYRRSFVRQASWHLVPKMPQE